MFYEEYDISNNEYREYDVYSTDISGVINISNSVLKITDSENAKYEIMSKLAGKLENRADVVDIALGRIFCRDIYGIIPSISDKDHYPEYNIFWSANDTSNSLDIILFVKDSHRQLLVDINNAETSDEKRRLAHVPPQVLTPEVIDTLAVDDLPKVGERIVFNGIIDLKQIFAPIKEKICGVNINEVLHLNDVVDFNTNKLNASLLNYLDIYGNPVFSNVLKFHSLVMSNQLLLDVDGRMNQGKLNDETNKNVRSVRTTLTIATFGVGAMIAVSLYQGFNNMVDSMGSMDGSMIAMNDNMSSMDGHMSSMSGSMTGMSTDMAGMDKKFGKMNGNIATMNTHVKELAKYTDVMSTSTGKMEKDMHQLVAPVKNLDISTRRINTNFGRMNETGDTYNAPMHFMNRLSPFWK